MASFPDDLNIRISGYQHQRESSLRRTSTEDGRIQQKPLLTQSRHVLECSSYIPNADWADFEDWFDSTLQRGALSFSMTDPEYRTGGATRNYRFVEGTYTYNLFDNRGRVITYQLEYWE